MIVQAKMFVALCDLARIPAWAQVCIAALWSCMGPLAVFVLPLPGRCQAPQGGGKGVAVL